MTSLKKVLIGIIFLILTIIPSKVFAEETIYDSFIKNISESTISHYVLKEDNFDHFLKNDDMTIYVVIAEKDQKLNVNILFVKENKSVFLRVNDNLNYKNYYAEGYGIIYNIPFEYNTTISLDVAVNGLSSPLDSATLPIFEEYDNYLTLERVITNGINEFPKNVLSSASLSTEQIFDIIIIAGLVICLILGIIIFLLIKNKKVNIKREEYFTYIKEEPTDEIVNDDIIDGYYEEPKEEQTNETIYNKDYLIDLYRKKFNGEITDAEFDAAMKRYLSAKDYEDEDNE